MYNFEFPYPIAGGDKSRSFRLKPADVRGALLCTRVATKIFFQNGRSGVLYARIFYIQYSTTRDSSIAESSFRRFQRYLVLLN